MFGEIFFSLQSERPAEKVKAVNEDLFDNLHNVVLRAGKVYLKPNHPEAVAYNTQEAGTRKQEFEVAFSSADQGEIDPSALPADPMDVPAFGYPLAHAVEFGYEYGGIRGGGAAAKDAI
ncbi:unnamed protein product [Tuber aestivum]|uniref:Uncharacterized protein n=1 Tax=Tuber aestivum TaxID=59557 RepID=A0A292Q3Y7_9PEZI|nr:unnamed protein product [Tuber aestivum]